MSANLSSWLMEGINAKNISKSNLYKLNTDFIFIETCNNEKEYINYSRLYNKCYTQYYDARRCS